AYWLRLRGCLAEAAANLLEQKKLWPGNAKRLLEISGDLSGLAAAVGGGRRELTPTEQVERQRYLDLSEKVAREAGAPQPKAGGQVSFLGDQDTPGLRSRTGASSSLRGLGPVAALVNAD